MTNIKKIAILQPEVPHYRTEFFDKLSAEFETTDIYVFKSLEATRKSGIKSGRISPMAD